MHSTDGERYGVDELLWFFAASTDLPGHAQPLLSATSGAGVGGLA